MTLLTDVPTLDWPHAKRVSQDELDELQHVCRAHLARGGETGAIAADILRTNDALTALIGKINAFLDR